MNPIIIIGGIALVALVVSQMNQPPAPEPPGQVVEEPAGPMPAAMQRQRAPLDAPVPVLAIELPRRR